MLSRHVTGASTSTAVLGLVVVFCFLASPNSIRADREVQTTAFLCARSLLLVPKFNSEPGEMKHCEGAQRGGNEKHGEMSCT